MPGFGNHHATEAVPNALPAGQNSPQKMPYGLYTEQLSGTAFTTSRSENRRSWLYRLRPTANHQRLSAVQTTIIQPERSLRRAASFPKPDAMGSAAVVQRTSRLHRWAGHLCACTAPMSGRASQNADGELLIVSQEGRLSISTEQRRMAVEPDQIVVIPGGLRFHVELVDGASRGYVCENYGALFRLPDPSPSGPTGWPTR